MSDAPVIGYDRMFHQGVRVPDLDTAMDELGSALGLQWSQPQQREQAVWFPESGSTAIALRFTYSREGPQRIELLEGAPGSVWDGVANPGLHHVGVWTDDLAADTAAFVAAGWTLRMAQRPPDEGYGVFTYVQPPTGFLVELVSTTVAERFERWFAGGSLA